MLLPHRRSGEKYVWHWVILVGKYIATSLPNSRDKWKRPASTVWEVYGYWGWCRASQTKQTSKTNHCSCLSLGEPIMHGWEEAEHQMEPPDQPELSFPFCASFKKKEVLWNTSLTPPQISWWKSRPSAQGAECCEHESGTLLRSHCKQTCSSICCVHIFRVCLSSRELWNSRI